VVNAIQSFLDERGTNPEIPVLSVPGCYAEQDPWAEFKRLWAPLADGFHAKSGSRLFGPLTDAMGAARINSMLVTVSKEKFRAYANPHLKTALGNEYASCALLCVAQICEYAAPKASSFILESGQPNVNVVKRTIEMMMDAGYPEWRISAVASAKKNDFIELHTADFVSHIASTYDKPWMKILFDLKLLKHTHLTEQNLKSYPR
jgi:hypothetical protein